MLEWPPDLASEPVRPLEDVAEAGSIDVEGDFVRIGSGATRLGPKEDEQRLTESERAVLAFELLGAGQLEVEAPQTGRIGSAKRDMVNAENTHRSQSREAFLLPRSGEIPALRGDPDHLCAGSPQTLTRSRG